MPFSAREGEVRAEFAEGTSEPEGQNVVGSRAHKTRYIGY